ncbi:peptidoglycan bridge formation glycyltransferase FemA/FemB family protein [Arthrobacter sp. H35-D1]|uniref:lipid II:glycine glycyltransferase FemX n=1 Tax=Arthrobacter sp. H35-D1 TaxID=3046202 RepID=UPI0024B97296|nr:peptidoglycan bridge formation glycyltransferase FemA/FemB family protein [Arthrobacter sp. H35-D1]MDJ0312405.1 peptidoglycan bridge formation glycyltransferase FemA/FemB family protein [Arthrobacter sp. H35-D1]
MKPILQTAVWAQFQRSLGKTVHEAQGPGWSFLAIEEKTPLGPYLYAPYGPCADGSAELAQSLTALAALARSVKAHYVRVEPVAAGQGTDSATILAAHGLLRAPSDVQPQLSWKVDLRQDEDALLRGMRSTSRNLFRNIHKKGVSFEVSTDPAQLPILLGFLHSVSSRADFTAQTDSYLRHAADVLMPAGAAKLFIAKLDGVPIAAALSYDTPDTRVYAHAAADDAHRKLNAGIPLLVTMMLEAKASGIREFDMWGVSPGDEPEHPWAGFSRFKRSFGGVEVEYPGTWDLPVNKPMYAAYATSRKARTLLVGALKTARSTAGSVRKKLKRG